MDKTSPPFSTVQVGAYQPILLYTMVSCLLYGLYGNKRPTSITNLWCNEICTQPKAI